MLLGGRQLELLGSREYWIPFECKMGLVNREFGNMEMMARRAAVVSVSGSRPFAYGRGLGSEVVLGFSTPLFFFNWSPYGISESTAAPL